MDFSKLNQNEKLAVYGAVVAVVAGIISNWGGLFWISVIAALVVAAMLVVPQVADATSSIGSRGTVLATLGIGAFVLGVIELLRFIGYFFSSLGQLSTIMFLVALIGTAVMAWVGWQELQKEGGAWQFGNRTASATASAAATAAPPVPAAPAELEAPAADTTAADTDEERRTDF